MTQRLAVRAIYNSVQEGIYAIAINKQVIAFLSQHGDIRLRVTYKRVIEREIDRSVLYSSA